MLMNIVIVKAKGTLSLPLQREWLNELGKEGEANRSKQKFDPACKLA